MNEVVNIFAEQLENRQWYERIRLLRNMNKWSMKVLAEKCIITEKAIWSWESGRSIPSKRNKKIVSAVLGVKEEIIFG